MYDDLDTSDLISLRAYQLWESEGRPHGRDLAHWLQAERELGAVPRAAAIAAAPPARRRSTATGRTGRKAKPSVSA